MTKLVFVTVAVSATCCISCSMSGVTNDALTMKDCRTRLELSPKNRPQSADPALDLDAICRNMLDISTSRMPKPAPSATQPVQK